jgi:regulator of nonsense transcripts 1
MGTILACATNAAADNLALKRCGLRVVRIGNPARCGNRYLRHSAWKRCATNSRTGRRLRGCASGRDLMDRVQQRLRLARAAKQEAQGRPSTVELQGDSSSGPAAAVVENGSAGPAQARKYGDAGCVFRTISSAQVVTSTCSVARATDLTDTIFRVVLVDEASQATEPSIMVPLTRGPECVILAGDPLQRNVHQLQPQIPDSIGAHAASCHHSTPPLYPCLSASSSHGRRVIQCVVRLARGTAVLCMLSAGILPLQTRR